MTWLAGVVATRSFAVLLVFVMDGKTSSQCWRASCGVRGARKPIDEREGSSLTQCKRRTLRSVRCCSISVGSLSEVMRIDDMVSWLATKLWFLSNALQV